MGLLVGAATLCCQTSAAQDMIYMNLLLISKGCHELVRRLKEIQFYRNFLRDCKKSTPSKILVVEKEYASEGEVSPDTLSVLIYK